jgi:hypothetical protein
LSVGGGVALAPGSLYADFPFSGRSWVFLLGPYNERLRQTPKGGTSSGVSPFAQCQIQALSNASMTTVHADG